MVLLGLQQTLPGVYEITPDAGSAFFLRINYLSQLSEEKLKAYVVPNGTLCLKDSLFASDAGINMQEYEVSAEDSEDILWAALCYSAEIAAMNYLSRAEQSRFGLTQKLLKKGIDKKVISKALDYLEEIHYLDDLRFAGAWLRNRSIDHFEGRRKLSMELAARGIGKEDSKAALDDFFAVRDEDELCLRCYKKLLRTKSDENKIRQALERNGFSYSQIKKVMNETSL